MVGVEAGADPAGDSEGLVEVPPAEVVLRVGGRNTMKTIVSVLKDGGIGIIPTDTLYGVVGQALSKKTVDRIYEVKGRDYSKPLIILISKISDLEDFAVPKSVIKKT